MKKHENHEGMYIKRPEMYMSFMTTGYKAKTMEYERHHTGTHSEGLHAHLGTVTSMAPRRHEISICATWQKLAMLGGLWIANF